ncbi:MAG TPA: alpha-amylase family glycosyl hydrolase, partial [Ktedonobacteraceae bacterium]|nr:alpha-amylase family glycosyl hydrolase [Ktedonobacteraceae bacterium]
HNRQIEDDKEKEAQIELSGIQIVLLLISPNFMTSGYLSGPEMAEIMAIHVRANIRIIPLILHPVRLEGTLIEPFQRFPLNGKAVMQWRDCHEAFSTISKAMRGVVRDLVQLGVHLLPDGAGANFRLWAPNASAVNVLLSTNVDDPFTSHPLERDQISPGYWSGNIRGVVAGNAYQFEITNRGGSKCNPGGPPFLRTDPCARHVTSSDPASPALIVDPAAFQFNAPFQTPAFENFIIYQAHVGSFAGRNDDFVVDQDALGGIASFAQFQSKLDYIRSMNFNAVQISPNGEYRGAEGETYNPSNYFAPEVLYGSPDDLRYLVDACHSRGLAVFLDMVYNHMNFMHNLWQFDGNTDHRCNERDPSTGGGIYLSTVETDFGRRPDHNSPAVQRFFIENAAMWFKEYHVDGLRFDGPENFSQSGLKAIVQKVIADFPDKFICAGSGDPNSIFNTIGFRACWDVGSADTFARIIANRDIFDLQTLIGHLGYPTASSAIKYLLGSHEQIYNRWSYDEKRRVWKWERPGHDGLRENRSFVERIGGAVTGRDNWYARAQARLGWALNVALPCTPLLFMGSECHHNGYWNPEIDTFGDHRFDWNIAGDQIQRFSKRLTVFIDEL